MDPLWTPVNDLDLQKRKIPLLKSNVLVSIIKTYCNIAFYLTVQYLSNYLSVSASLSLIQMTSRPLEARPLASAPVGSFLFLQQEVNSCIVYEDGVHGEYSILHCS